MKNLFIKSTIILMISTIITRLLGFVIRVSFTRIIGSGIEIYSLILPTMSLLTSISTLSLPYVISVIVANKKYKNKDIITNIIPISLLFNILLIGILFLTAPYISHTLLKNDNTYLPLISFSLVIPFQTISGILKGYYFGKQNMVPSAISNVLEQLIRLLLLFIFVKPMVYKGINEAIITFIIITALAEIIQIIIYLIYLPKKVNLKLIKFKKEIINDVFKLSIPLTSSRIIGNISYFLEPIILTNLLIFNNYSYDYIISNYAIYNAYVIPLLTLPSFFTQTINTSLLPEISKNINNPKRIKKILHKTLLITLTLGTIFCLITFFKGDLFLSIIYNTNKGFNYIKVLSLFFPLFYLESTLQATLQATFNASYQMKVTTISTITKIISLIILCNIKIGIYALIISEIINIIQVIYLYIRKLKKLNYI